MDVTGQLRELSKPHAEGEKIPSIIERTARLAGLSYSRCYEIYYRRARRIEQAEFDAIKEALRIKNERAARNEFHELKFRLAKLEAALASRDADFHSPEIDFAGDILRGMGGMAGAGVGGGRRR